MSKSSPSLIALLGLVAVAGYQVRGRIGEMLNDAQQKIPADTSRSTGIDPSGGFLAKVGSLFGGGAAGGILASGLGDLINRFKESGLAAPADTWV